MIDYIEEKPINGSLTIDQAKQALVQGQMDSNMYKLFGRDNVESLVKLLTQPDCIDIDMLILTEDLGREVADQYTSSLSGFRMLEREIADLAKAFVENIIGDNRLQYYFDRTFDEKTNRSTREKFVVVSGNGVPKLFGAIQDIIMALMPKVSRSTFRSGRLMEFLICYQQFLYQKILDFLLNDEKIGNEKKNCFDEIFGSECVNSES